MYNALTIDLLVGLNLNSIEFFLRLFKYIIYNYFLFILTIYLIFILYLYL